MGKFEQKLWQLHYSFRVFFAIRISMSSVPACKTFSLGVYGLATVSLFIVLERLFDHLSRQCAPHARHTNWDRDNGWTHKAKIVIYGCAQITYKFILFVYVICYNMWGERALRLSIFATPKNCNLFFYRAASIEFNYALPNVINYVRLFAVRHLGWAHYSATIILFPYARI